MNSNKTQSRGPMLDNELCVENVGNRFDLVLIAAARSREISKKNKDNPDASYINPGVSALLDVQSKLVDRSYLKKVR